MPKLDCVKAQFQSCDLVRNSRNRINTFGLPAARIWTVVGVVCDIFDALLDPDSLLVQLVFPEREVIQLSLEIYQLICYFSGVTSWAYTPETEKQCMVLYIKPLPHRYLMLSSRYVTRTQLSKCGFILFCSTRVCTETVSAITFVIWQL